METTEKQRVLLNYHGQDYDMTEIFGLLRQFHDPSQGPLSFNSVADYLLEAQRDFNGLATGTTDLTKLASANEILSQTIRAFVLCQEQA